MKKHDDDLPEDVSDLKARARSLGLHGLLAQWHELEGKPWLGELLDIEEKERKRRSLERRIRAARIGAFKSMTDFDWTWPKSADREALEELFSFSFVGEGSNAVLLGPNGVGKTMMIRNRCVRRRTPPGRFVVAGFSE